MPEVKPEIQTFAKIKVIGVGGGGGSAINRMVQSGLKGVEFIAVNTDLKALQLSLAGTKIHIGKTTTKGLGAGMDPITGRKAAEETQNELRDCMKGADLIFITCGLGGGTGSGAGPKVAEISREMGALTIAVVTKPFSFEGIPRKRNADDALKEFQGKVDTLITIPNDRIWQIIDKKTPLQEAFGIVDEVLRQGVQGISELITLPGLIGVDFADVKTIMGNSGAALMGMGEATGDNRAIEAAKAAISSPLLEVSIEGAKGIVFTICGGPDLAMYEVSEAAKIITESVDADAKIIFGAIIDEKMKDQIKITVVATGFEDQNPLQLIKTGTGMIQPTTKRPNYFSAPAPAAPARSAEPISTQNNAYSDPVSTPSPAAQPIHREEPRYGGFDVKKMSQFIAQEEEASATASEDVPNSINNINNNNNRINPADVLPPRKQKSDDPFGEDGDIDIPPFLRKKMM